MKKQDKKILKNVDVCFDFLKDSAIFLLFAMTSILVLTSFLFLFHVSISKWHLPVIYGLAIISYLIFKRKNSKRALGAILVSSLVFIIATFLVGKTYDMTADGNTYHKLAVGAMKNGWNPVYQDVVDFTKKKGNPFTITKDNVNIKWADHYAKGTEIFGAVVYAFTGNIEAGKVFNLLWIYVGLFVLYFIFRLMKLAVWKSLLFAVVLAINPIIAVQITNYYLDGVLSISLFILILCAMYQEKMIKDIDSDEKVEYYGLFAMAIIWCVNAKFTGLAYAAIFCFVFYLYRHIKNYIQEKKKFKDLLIKDTVFYVITVVIAVLIVGSNSYVRNFIDHGHPLYPLYGKGHSPNMVMLEIPSSLQKADPVTIFFTSLFAKGENVTPSYMPGNNQPDFKIPFTFTEKELKNYTIPDIRMAGFGPLFSGVFVLTCIGFVMMLFSYIRKKNWSELGPKALFMVTSMLLLLFLDGSYWARYVPYVYLFPIIVCLYLMENEFTKKKVSVGLSFVIFFFLIVNSILILNVQYEKIRDDRRYIIQNFETLKADNAKKKKIMIKLFHSGVQGVQYNLDDYNIRYTRSDDKDIKNQGYFFYFKSSKEE